jgi:Flp pilus assembly protein CpaB
MEAHGRLGKSGGNRPGSRFSGRQSSVLIALVAAVAAGLLIYLFVSHYNKKNSPTAATPSTATIVVAKKFIAAGTPDSLIISANLLKTEVVASSQVLAGAISDPSAISGEVASASIAAGQQITLADFSHATVTLSAYLSGDFRAVGLTIGAVNGLTSYLTVGSKVDVVAGSTKDSTSLELFNNVTVLSVNTTGFVVLKLTQKQVLELTSAEDQGLSLWFTLRPLNGATDPVAPLQIEKVTI